jgi:glycerol uptake facilitator-like aquaporin
MNKYIIEFLGTFLLSAVIFSTTNYLAHGAALATALFLGAAISGDIFIFNPAIATSMMVANKITQMDYILYLIVEVLGALAGFVLVKKIW